MNDRCAAGTGRFFEAMARVLDCGLQGLSELSLQGKNPATISSQCSVFAESEVITLVNEGVDLADIVAGLHASIASRLNSMVRKVGLVEDKLGVSVKKLPLDPQIAGAIGAALIAAERVSKQTMKSPA
jgi:activator of 2-hydroxyglutaryl-CoA dehydratase